MNNRRFLRIIQWSVFCILFGRGILHFTSEQPYSILFSDPSSIFHQKIDFNLNHLQISIGIIHLIFAFFSILSLKWLKEFRLILLFPIPITLLLIHCYATFIQSHFVPEQFIEHALQLFLPLIFMHAVIKNTNFALPNSRFPIYILIAFTFIGHGIYAIGFHYVPSNFKEMVINSFHFNELQTNHFLFFIGLIDFITSVLIFTRFLQKESLVYMFIWGFLTSFARLYAYIGIVDFSTIVQENIFQVLLRLPHAFIPLGLLIWETRTNMDQLRLARSKNHLEFNRSSLKKL